MKKKPKHAELLAGLLAEQRIINGALRLAYLGPEVDRLRQREDDQQKRITELVGLLREAERAVDFTHSQAPAGGKAQHDWADLLRRIKEVANGKH